jgi:uncharacterized protein (TIGR03435 family)
VLKSSLPFWAVATAVSAFAQRPAEAPPRFDVVAIKPNNSGEAWSSGSPIKDKVGLYAAGNASLRTLITWFYGVNEPQIAGGPRWLGADRYDIDAQVDGQPSRAQVNEMLKTLLADRFQSQFHVESREMPRYTLVAAKNGLTFGPHLAKADGRDCSAVPAGGPGCRGIGPGPQSMEMEHVTFAVVAATLSNMAGQVVADETGLDGSYDIKLDLLPSGGNSAISFGDTVMDALRDQIGLRVESRKAPTRILVIERAEKPTDN